MTEPGPGPSTISQCALCSQTSKYTCPRCDIKTCSLACSKSHKSKDNCSGERDRSKYVRMNEYGWGTLADDYSYLEDLGRNVVTWGRDLSKAKGKAKWKSPKLEALRVQLAARDVKIQFVAEGMEKRRLNQSSWDPRTKTIYLTVEYVFHLQDSQPIRILTHRNNFSLPLGPSLVAHLKHKSDIPASVLDLISSNDPRILYTIARNQLQGQETKYQAPAINIRLGSTSAPTRPKIRKVFYPFDASRSLQECLKGREMVEYPTIDVFASKMVLLASRLGELDENAEIQAQEEPPLKKRKTEPERGGLVGYGGDSESDDPGAGGGIGLLGGYGSAEEEDEGLGESLGSDSHSS
ncbi:zf-HIT domain protein [Rhizoctonia solani 123E]|uniref:Zf-HIT domain protein n=1 Tax=Rhizoctonia solani 123E TaxID=1423351 RepID=A0A074S8A6_9AGAM|nr:zf-HIT domain protein [Rhizoctonia solani 123E]